jgi:CheY-like chemotaxis protein
MQERIEEQMSRNGFSISIFTDLLEMVRSIEVQRPASILLDADCNGQEGTECVKELRSWGYSGPIGVLTSSRERNAAAAALRAGADHILFKPVSDFEIDIFAEKIRIGHPRGGSVVDAIKAILQPVDQGILMFGEDRDLLFANVRALEVLGVETDTEAGRLVAGNCPDGFLEQSREKKTAIAYIDIAVPHGGRNKLLGLEACYLDSLPGTPYYLVLIQDFSSWKKLDELRTRFATSLSHRMRTPLTAVRNAVKILSGEDGPIQGTEKERLLDIGWRNIEKLIANLDELQKIFMIESEEMNVCRTLLRVKKEMKPLLDDLESEGKIRGYKIKMPDISIFAGRGRLRDFVATAVEAYGKWMNEVPFLEVLSSEQGDQRYLGGANRKLKISLKSRVQTRAHPEKETMKEYLSYHEAHLGLVLDRLAAALDGDIELSRSGTISLLLPIDPPFNREKDLVHPLLMMAERAELMNGEFHLVTLRMVGMIGDHERVAGLLDRSLCKCVCRDGIVSRGEEPASYSIFFIDKTREEIEAVMKSVQERFERSCSESGEEFFPSVRWEIRCSRSADSEDSCLETPLIEELI